MQVGFIIILIIAIFVAIFAIQNGTPVPVDLFFARYEMPLAVIMMICLILGAVVILVLGTTRQFKKRSEHKELTNKLKALEGERARYENDLKAWETEKSNLETNMKALESEKEKLQNKIAELGEKIALLEKQNKDREEEIAIKEQEIQSLQNQNINGIKVSEISDEGVMQIDNENSEAQGQ